MTDLLLDQILADTREPEPYDEAFVQIVMNEVKADAQRQWRMRRVRRPLVMGIAVAALATSGAVAALVGTNQAKSPQQAARNPGATQITASAPKASNVATSSAPTRVATGATPASKAPTVMKADGLRWGFPSSHTAYIVDERNGLKLTTETYTNNFSARAPQRVTLTIENLGSDPVAISGADGCALNVIATSGSASTSSCATDGVATDKIVLGAGATHTADATVVLPKSGTWSIVGVCRCGYTQVTTERPTKGNSLLGELTNPVDVSPADLPKKSSPTTTTRLSTPAIVVNVT